MSQNPQRRQSKTDFRICLPSARVIGPLQNLSLPNIFNGSTE
jgi:hypothetical protein